MSVELISASVKLPDDPVFAVINSAGGPSFGVDEHQIYSLTPDTVDGEVVITVNVIEKLGVPNVPSDPELVTATVKVSDDLWFAAITNAGGPTFDPAAHQIQSLTPTTEAGEVFVTVNVIQKIV